MGRFQTVALAEHHLARQDATSDKLWKDLVPRHSLSGSQSSSVGTSVGRPRRGEPLALAAQSMEQESLWALWVRFVTNGLGESGENLENVWELFNLIRGNDWLFICMEDWSMTPEEM